MTFECGIHEIIAHAHAQIFVLIHDRAIGIAVIAAVIALLDQRPGLLLFFLFRVNELFNVRMPVLERVHLGGAARFATALHYVGNLIVDLEERERPARFAAPAQFLAGAAQGR